MKQSKGEALLAFQLKAHKIKHETEWKFHPTREWRFDFAFFERMLAVEIEGGVWLGAKGGHTSGAGYIKNLEKYNAAQQLGWAMLRFTPQQVKSGEAILRVQEYLKLPT